MTRNLVLTFLSVCLLSGMAFSQNKPAYVVFTGSGKKSSYSKMLKKLESSQLIFFGELHDNPIAHWLELEITKDLFIPGKLTLGAEMIETDNQIPLDLYLNSTINLNTFDSLTRLWSNYHTDYAPLVDFAKDNHLSFIATNIPRRHARTVHRKGFEGLNDLSNNEKQWIAPLPVPFDPQLPTYQKILEMMGDHGSPELVKAQAIKDATMAHFILKHLDPNGTFIHFNGSFHSNYREGICWYIEQWNKDIEFVTIATVIQQSLKKLDNEHLKKADFIICVDEDMISTY